MTEPGVVDITVSALIARAAAALPGDSPRLDAELLMAQALHRARTWLYAHSGDPVPAEAEQRFAALIARRAAGESVAGIRGIAEFWSLELEVTPATLVPRPDTECLVERVLAAVNAPAARVLDLGTGSGAIALALARERPGWDITGVDIDPAAVAVATRNAQRHVIGNAHFVAGDWYGPVAGSRFAVIVSNPPYIRADDPCLTGPGLSHEPRRALASGADGLDALRAVIAAAPAYLAPGGLLACEHGADQGEAVRALFVAAGFEDPCTSTDLAGHDRVTAGYLKASRPAAQALNVGEECCNG